MNKFQSLNRIDLIFIIGTGLFFFSCVATTLQLARTKEPGQAEVSGGYMHLRSIDEFSEEPGQLIGMNARMGVANNFDVGLSHAFDVSKDGEGLGNSFWGDAKIQLSNKENENNKLTFATGLLKGYLYKDDLDLHFTTLPLYFSLPVNDRVTPMFLYRYGLASDGFLPNSDSFDDPRHTFALGLEFNLKEPDPAKWVPKFAFTIGTIQSFNGDSDDSGTFLVNFGFKFDSPYGQK